MGDNERVSHSDEFWMEEALREGERARAWGEVPVGAIIVFEGNVVGRGSNRVIVDSDPTAHAEIVAIRAAAKEIGNYRLNGCEMYVTVEPCAMCAGALVHARVARLIYGTPDAKAGAVTSVMQILAHPAMNHSMTVTAGVLAARCMEQVQSFFRGRREAKREG